MESPVTDGVLPWEQPGWLDEARAWIRARLEARGLELSGGIEQPHIRPWSTVLTAPTRDGVFYFKASAPVLAHEAALTAFLARLRPDLLPDLLAVDETRSWMLMAGSGTRLRAFIQKERSLSRWQAILPLYAGLQKDTAGHIAELLRLGVFDRRLHTLPGQFETLAASQDGLLIGMPDGLTALEARRLRALGPRFSRMCAELDSFGIPPGLHHDDFHDGNLFLRGEQVIFTDWGEAAVAHPFFTLVVLLRGASNSLDLNEDAPELDQLREWVLAQWTEHASPAELRYAAHLAERIGLVNRALTWQRVIQAMPPAQRPAFASAVPSYLRDFLITC
jgi:hypothetical protein